MAELLINAAVLHIFDYQSNQTILSDVTMNLDDKTVEHYIRKSITKCMVDMRNQKGFFQETSPVLSSIKQYQAQQMNFIAVSKQISQLLQTYLQQTTKAYDVLFSDFTYEQQRYLAFYILENQMAYTHMTKTNVGIENTIVKQASLLPTTSKKIQTYAFINLTTFEIAFVDEMHWKHENVLQQLVLDCTYEKSKQEVFQKVNDIVEEVALEVDSNPTLLLGKYKNYVKQAFEDALPLTQESLATNVFNESEEMQNTFISSSLQHELPKEVEIPKQYVSRKTKSQRIKTDTGIELTFPTEYSENAEFIEFVRKEDGTISIEIKNVGEIINKA